MEFVKNQEVIVTIEDMGTDGEGIGKINGYTLFVKDALIGDRVCVILTKLKKNYGYARVKEIVEPSKDRVNPPCELNRRCGGCQIQALSYEKQLEYKYSKVRNNLIRLGDFSEELVDGVMQPVVGMDNESEYGAAFRYRNKAQYPIGTDKEGNPIAGFYAQRTHCIIPVKDCLLGVEDNSRILSIIISHMKKYGIEAYDENTHKGLVRHVLIRKGFDSGELMISIIINSKKKNKAFEWLKGQNDLITRLTEIKDVKSISVCLNTMENNVIMGDIVHTIWGEKAIMDTLHIRDTANDEFIRLDSDKGKNALKFNISPLSFYQVNPYQTEKLYSLALDYAGLTGNETVWDLYCGIGTISLFMAVRAKEVWGIEIIPQAIEDAKENARINGIENAKFFVGRAEDIGPDDLPRPDVIVVDPPRKGCDEDCLNTMIKVSPKRIVYVSCDSATLARDLKVLCAAGYELCRVRPVDQFGHTTHVETCCLLVREQIKDDDLISIKVDLEGISLEQGKYVPEEKPTYGNVKKWIKEKYGFNVTNLYIGQIKDKLGLEKRKNYNVGSGEGRVPNCPQEKEEAIVEAFKHFGLI